MQPYGIELKSYREQAVATMTQGEMLIVLYDETIKRLKKAKVLMGNNDFDNAEADIKRAQEIITYLDSILDRKYAISGNLSQLYRFFNYQMIRISAGRHTELIDELVPLVEEMRDTFKEADLLNKQSNQRAALDRGC